MQRPRPRRTAFGPIKVGPYQVKQNDYDLGIPKPAEDGYITGMEVDIVDSNGSKVPISRLMLHHIVFANIGPELGSKRDGTCGQFTQLDSRTRIPAWGERFYAAGEERAKMILPKGYGYESKGQDRWAMTWMMMNHRRVSDSAYIEYKVTVRHGAAEAGYSVLARREELPLRPDLRRAGRGQEGLDSPEIVQLDGP